MSIDKKSGLLLSNARTPEQKELMEKIIADGVCPFCAEHFRKYHPKPILKETEHWFFTENMSPYKGTKHHFIFVYKPRHIREISEVPADALADLFALASSAAKENGFPGGAFFIRFGDHHYTGGSVEHLHAHLLQGDADAPGHEPVRVKLG
jgi:ATP adenylyltransferase